MNCSYCGQPVLPDQMVKVADLAFHWECVLQAGRTAGLNLVSGTKHPRLFSMRSIVSDKVNEMVIWMTHAQFAEISDQTSRRVIQEVLPDASAEEREFLISGMSPQEQHEFFERSGD